MRGAQGPPVGGYLEHGIIPAYAGSTLAGRIRPCKTRDHPRVCGEHPVATALPLVRMGSSPRMRGAPGHVDLVCELVGIIPAYAGSTASPCCPAAASRDHPRVCGEHTTLTGLDVKAPGSSPRMRGARRLQHPGNRRPGIIPAYAGSTSTMPTSCSPSWDHPRVCGEHGAAGRSTSRPAGSSPRMRGARHNCMFFVCKWGIIPAYAGSTEAQNLVALALGDHPRVCGEHRMSGDVAENAAGSSPRMRGAPLEVRRPGREGGIIPAYAGSTPTKLVRDEAPRDHPRVCGEHPRTPSAVTPSVGSSPRMRGAPARATFYPRAD